MTEKIQRLAGQVATLTVVELRQLVIRLRSVYGIVFSDVNLDVGPLDYAEDPVDDVSGIDFTKSYDVYMTNYNEQKLAAVKIVRNHLGCGLKEAKELVESAPITLMHGLSRSKAELIVEEFKVAGIVDVKAVES